MNELKNPEEIRNAAAEDEILKLQIALEQTLEELQRLRNENMTLSHQNEKNRDSLQSRMKELQRLKTEVSQLNARERKLNHQVAYTRNQLNITETRYEALAGSALGRLTLNYWSWINKNDDKGKFTATLSFLTHWLTNRLPEATPLELPEPQKEEADNVKPDAPSEVTPELIMSQEQEQWINAYLDRIAAIADSNGCRFYEALPYRIGLICDEFFYESISAAANFVFITPENWQEELNNGLDAMLFVTAWRGLHEEWRGLGAVKDIQNNPIRRTAFEILDSCEEKGIPTVFYSKEDPPNYEVFLDYARHCKYIRTTAEECIPYYKNDCGEMDIRAVCFGINPVFHNPIGFRSAEKEDTVLFSGSWMLKYPERCKELAEIFDGIISAGHGLHIIDRNYPGNVKYRFPDKYFPYSSPAIEHDLLQKVHKLFDWAVNINSVKGSRTMFANRAFELQANGVLLLSNFSVGVNEILPTVQMVPDSSEVAPIMNSLTAEDRYQRQITGIRSVMTGHTCFDRIGEILAETGLACSQPVRRILVLADEITEAVQSNFERQTYPYKMLRSSDTVTAKIVAEYDMVTWFSTDARYSAFYLEDLSNAFKYTACDYITKDAWIEGNVLHGGIEHDYVDHMRSKYRTLFWVSAYKPEFLLSISGEMPLENGYSIDRFGYETAPICARKTSTNYRLTVVIPIYNNGKHLLSKCFESLHRSSLFRELEVILVDDGSDDSDTMKIEESLRDSYSNVCLFRFTDNYSGSSGRARNRGIELASAPYVTILEPGNEAVCDGYGAMLASGEGEYDILMGNLYQYGVELKSISYYDRFSSIRGDILNYGIQDVLIQTDFLSADLQCALFRRELFSELKQIEGAEGGETLLLWQLFYAAKSIRFVDVPVYMTYSRTSPAITEPITIDYFEKLLPVQQEKLLWLRSVGLLGDFMERRYESYMVNWLLKKLSLANGDQAQSCASLVYKIHQLFAPYWKPKHSLLVSFVEKCDSGDLEAAFACILDAFPRMEKRPMLTLDEILGGTAKSVSIPVECSRDGSNYTFINRSDLPNSTYAWVVLLAGDTYQKVFSSKYSTDSVFTFDFSNLPAATYRVRAFVKENDQKHTVDAAVIEVDGFGGARFLSHKSSAIMTKEK